MTKLYRMGFALFFITCAASAARPLLEDDGVVYINGDGSLAQEMREVFDQLVYVNGWTEEDAKDFCRYRTDEWRRRNYRSINDTYTTHKHSKALVSAPRGPAQRADRAIRHMGSSVRNAGQGFWSRVSRWGGRRTEPAPAARAHPDDDEFVMVDRDPEDSPEGFVNVSSTPLRPEDFNEPDEAR